MHNIIYTNINNIVYGIFSKLIWGVRVGDKKKIAHKLIIVPGRYIRVHYSVLSDFVCLNFSTLKSKNKKNLLTLDCLMNVLLFPLKYVFCQAARSGRAYHFSNSGF